MTEKQNPILAEWRRQHRRGKPSTLEIDAEVRLFVEQSFPTMTFDEIGAAVTRQFGPERRTSRSALSRYWRKHKARLLAESAGDESRPELGSGG